MRFFKTQGEKNSSPEKTQGNFGAKTQGTGAFSTSFHSKLNQSELYIGIDPLSHIPKKLLNLFFAA